MKNKNPLILLLLLILLPIASWYYLKTGLEYRKDALTELEDRGRVSRYLTVDENILKDKTTLIEIDPSIDPSLREQVFHQFKDAYSFQYMSPAPTDIEAPNYLKLPQLNITNDSIKGATYLAVDGDLQVRNIYTLTDKESIQDMVSQMSILLPWAPERDIKQKSNHGG